MAPKPKPTKRAHKALSYDVKMKIISDRDSGMRCGDIAEKYNLAKSTVASQYSKAARDKLTIALRDNVSLEETRYNKYQRCSLIRDVEMVLMEIVLRLKMLVSLLGKMSYSARRVKFPTNLLMLNCTTDKAKENIKT